MAAVRELSPVATRRSATFTADSLEPLSPSLAATPAFKGSKGRTSDECSTAAPSPFASATPWSPVTSVSSPVKRTSATPLNMHDFMRANLAAEEPLALWHDHHDFFMPVVEEGDIAMPWHENPTASPSMRQPDLVSSPRFCSPVRMPASPRTPSPCRKARTPWAPVRRSVPTLASAVLSGRATTVRETLKAAPGAAQEFFLPQGSALCVAASAKCDTEIFELLLDARADVGTVDSKGRTALDILRGHRAKEDSQHLSNIDDLLVAHGAEAREDLEKAQESDVEELVCLTAMPLPPALPGFA